MDLPQRVYIDTNIVSRFADQRVNVETARAFGELSLRKDIVLVTSDKTLEEIQRAKDPTRVGVLQLLVALFAKVPMQSLRVAGGVQSDAFAANAFQASYTDPTFAGLATIFDRDDAEHIAHATNAGCEFFLTLDEVTILSRFRASPESVSALVGRLRLVNPVELAKTLEERATFKQVASQAAARAGMASLARLARLDQQLVELLEREQVEKPEDSAERLAIFEHEIGSIESALKGASDEDRFHLASQLRDLYREYLWHARQHWASSAPYQRARAKVMDGFAMIERLG